MAAVENHLLAISQVPSNTGHSLHKGTPREAFIKEFLENHLNSTVAIGSGEIIDCHSEPNAPRNQFDIIVYKRSYPKLHFGGGLNGFLAESVIATIEVKSTLDKAGIEQAVKAAAAAKKLQRNINKAFEGGYIPPSILSLVVAYDGPASMETVHGWIKSAYASQSICEPIVPPGVNRSEVAGPALEGVYVLGKGFTSYFNDPYICPVMTDFPDYRWLIVDKDRGCLLSLFTLLTVATGNVDGSWLNPLPYLKNFKAMEVVFGK